MLKVGRKLKKGALLFVQSVAMLFAMQLSASTTAEALQNPWLRSALVWVKPEPTKAEFGVLAMQVRPESRAVSIPEDLTNRVQTETNTAGIYYRLLAGRYKEGDIVDLVYNQSNKYGNPFNQEIQRDMAQHIITIEHERLEENLMRWRVKIKGSDSGPNMSPLSGFSRPYFVVTVSRGQHIVSGSFKVYGEDDRVLFGPGDIADWDGGGIDNRWHGKGNLNFSMKSSDLQGHNANSFLQFWRLAALGTFKKAENRMGFNIEKHLENNSVAFVERLGAYLFEQNPYL